MELVGSGVIDFFRGILGAFVDLLTERPVPRDGDGSVSLLGTPANEPMQTVYGLWETMALPAAGGIWVLYMLVLRFVDLIPGAALHSRRARGLKAKGWFTLPLIVLSFAYAAFVLWLSVGLSSLFAPDPATMLPGTNALVEHALAGGVIGVILFAWVGFLAILMVIEFCLTYVAIFILAPALPVFMALELPDVGPLRYLAGVGKSLQGWFVPSAMMPVPTAIILGLGYPVINELRTGAMESGIGPALLGVPFWVILLVAMWSAALIAPIALLLGNKHTRPAAMIAGALGAIGGIGLLSAGSGAAAGGASTGAAAGSASGSAGGAASAIGAAGSNVAGALPGGSGGGGGSSGGGGRVNPLTGSPFSTDGGTGTLATSSASSSPTAAAEGGPSPTAPASAAPESGGTLSPSSSASAGQTQTPPSGGSGNRRQEAVPSDQSYEIGYYRDTGEWKEIETTTFDRDWLVNGGYDRIQDVHAEEGHNLKLRGAEDETVYSVPGTNVEEAYQSQASEGRNTVPK